MGTRGLSCWVAAVARPPRAARLPLFVRGICASGASGARARGISSAATNAPAEIARRDNDALGVGSPGPSFDLYTHTHLSMLPCRLRGRPLPTWWAWPHSQPPPPPALSKAGRAAPRTGPHARPCLGASSRPPPRPSRPPPTRARFSRRRPLPTARPRRLVAAHESGVPASSARSRRGRRAPSNCGRGSGGRFRSVTLKSSSPGFLKIGLSFHRSDCPSALIALTTGP